MATPVQMPQMAAPIVEPDGRATSAFRSLLETLWRRTGNLFSQQTGIATTQGSVIDLNELAPVGEMVLWPAPTPVPQGWLQANGANISRANFSVLFQAIGVTYGNGDGVTTFGLPNIAPPYPLTIYIIRALPEPSI